MKLILILITSILCSGTCAALTNSDLTCSRYGTDIIWVNGVNWNKKHSLQHMEALAKAIPSSYIDGRKTILGTSPIVNYTMSYNFAASTTKDFLESFAQKVNIEFGIPLE
jgi:hypothetical protein